MFQVPHHDGSALYVPSSPALGSCVPVRLRVPRAYGEVLRVFVRSLRDAEPHYDEAVLLASGNGGWDWWEATVRVVNPVTRYRFLLEVTGVDKSSWHWLNAEGFF